MAKRMPTTLSACLVVCNEESRIKDCLESIKNCVDEIIVVHDGPCADKTLDIAKKYTKNIFVHQKVGNAEILRSYAYRKSTGDWILKIDADERLSKEAQRKIRNLKKNI